MNIAYAQAREYILYPYETVYYGRTFDFAPVPLPAAFPLLASGLGLLGWRRKRKASLSPGV